MLDFNILKRRRRSQLLPILIVADVSAAAGFIAGLLLFRRRRSGAAALSKQSGKRVEQAMTRDPHSITPAAPVAEAARLMRDEDVGSVPVVDDGRLVGMLTDRDIALRLVAEGRDAHATAVADVASGKLVTVRPEHELDTALQLMAQYQVRRLPVVEDERLVGIVAQADVALEGLDRQTGEVVERISREQPAA